MNSLRFMLPLVFLTLPLSAQKAVHDLDTLNARNSAIASFPNMIANMGDMDKDGFDDMAVGVPSNTFNPSGDGSVVLLSGATGREIGVIHGSNRKGSFGRQVVNVGDVDKDGVPDICIGAPTSPSSASSTGYGMVFVYSGKTRKLIRTIKTPIGSTRDFGIAIDGIGDVDKDGHADFVVGAPLGGSTGSAYIISGKTGSIHARLSQTLTMSKFGQSVVGIPDVDSDQIPDVAILGHFAKINNATVYGPIWVFSGRHGGLIYTIKPSPTYTAGPSVLLRTCPDIDGDKKEDLMIGFPYGSLGSQYFGEIDIYSSGTGKRITRLKSPGGTAGSSFGYGFAAIPDMDQDGSPEVLVSDYRFISGNASAGAFHLFSAKTGKWMRTFTSNHTKRNLVRVGHVVDFLGDLNRDGNPDFVSFFHETNVANRQALLLSVNPLDLSSDVKSISLFRGGKSAISIHAGTRHAKSLVMMIGSASGTYPGIKIGQGTLHLNMDSYLQFTLAAPHALFWNNLSQLDSNGEGGVGFVLPTGLHPSLAGTRFHHSCLLIGTRGLEFANISIPLDLTLF